MPQPDVRLAAADAPYQERARAVLGSLRSYFLEMPRGNAFCERDDFERGYKVLRKATNRGAELDGEALLSAIGEEPRVWLVLLSTNRILTRSCSTRGCSAGPYASHRDSVSGIVGKLIESAVTELLERHEIDGRAIRDRENVPGFEQAPRRRTIVAIIDGRGFGHRVADLNRMLKACEPCVRASPMGTPALSRARGRRRARRPRAPHRTTDHCGDT